MSDLAKRFGEELREARIWNGYTSRTLGLAVGAKEKLVLSWELGHTLPTWRHYAALIKLFPSLPRYSPREPRQNVSPGGKVGRVVDPSTREKIGAGREAFWNRYGF